MSEDFANVYQDQARAEAYSKLEFPGTYFLAFRDLPELITQHVCGSSALDFGCGTGRSCRFLRQLGFETVGVDIAAPMLERARSLDPQGDYRLLPDGDFAELAGRSFDLVLAAFTFDNIATMERKVQAFQELRRVLAPGGRIVAVVSAAEIYLNEWASFSTQDFPENRQAKSGDTVRIIMLDVEDRRPVEDILCSGPAYQEVFERAGLDLIQTHQPLGRPDEPFDWVSETSIAPWTIYVLGHPSRRLVPRSPAGKTLKS